jgi:hypothetical protein
MATATTTKTKLPKVGSKRKAEEVKEVRTKDSKKVKVDKAQKPLKSKAPKESKATKEKSKPSVTKSARAPFQQDSNSEDEDDSDVSEDGGVPLGADVDMEDEEEDKENELEGVHPDRVKAVAPGAGPNGSFQNTSIVSYLLTLPRYIFQGSPRKAKAACRRAESRQTTCRPIGAVQEAMGAIKEKVTRSLRGEEEAY